MGFAPKVSAQSSTLSAANPWFVYGLGGSPPYFNSLAQFAQWTNYEEPSEYVTGYGGPITSPAFSLSCSASQPCWYVYFEASGSPISLITQYQYSAPYGQVCADGSYAPSGQDCMGKSLGAPFCLCSAGDPIDTASGNVFEQAVDYETAGANKLRFVRYYNSRASLTTPAFMLGFFWRSNYDRYIRILSSTSVLAERADGQQLSFTLIDGTWTPDSDVDYTLTASGTATTSGTTWTLTDPHDTVESYTTGSTGTVADLNTIAARNGYTRTLTYTSGQLTSVTDSYSRTLTLSYSSGLLSSVATPDSTTITYGYTATTNGSNLTSVTFPTSPSSTVTYQYGNSSLPSALTAILDEDGNTYESWTYDAYGRGLTSAMGGSLDANLTTLTYNDSNGSRTVTNALGVTDTYSFSTLQNIPKVTGISRAATGSTAAATESFTYDTNGYLASVTDWNGNETAYTNNSHGLPTQIVEASGSSVQRTTTIAYDSTWVHLPDSITTPGDTTSFTYDGSGNPLTRTDTDTTSQSTPYSTNGQTRTWTYTWSDFLPATVESPNGNTTTFAFSSSGALTSITDALSHETQITGSTGGGLPETIVDPNGTTTTLSYDARQRLTSKEVAVSGLSTLTTTYTLDPTGELNKLTLPDGSYLSYTYDAAHRVTQVENALGYLLEYTLDALGDVTQTGAYFSADDQRYSHSDTYDALGRLLTDVGASSQTTTYSYDPDGNALTTQDGNDHTATRVFDALNRLSSITDANSGVTGYTYDAHDRITQATDDNGNATAYVYDGFGDRIQQASPDTGTTVYHYDADANLTQKVDGAGVTTDATYDALDRIETRTFPADSTQNVTYTYDKTTGLFGAGIGRLSTMTDAAGYVNLDYDGFGHVLSTRRYVGGTDETNVNYAYDAYGRLKGLTYPSGVYIGYTFDASGNISEVVYVPPGSETATAIAWPSFYPFGPLKYLTFDNSIGEAFTRTLDYLVRQVEDTAGSTTLRNISYTYDAAYNMTGISDAVNSANSQTLTYDAINRLTGASSGTGGYGTLAWTYDKVGNVTGSTAGGTSYSYTYTSGSNQLSGITWPSNSESFTTNGNGNITGVTLNSTATFGGTYNVANRLSAVADTDPAISGMVYDGWGQRYSKADSGGNTITYAYDLAGHLIEENNSVGGTTDYVYLGDRPIAIYVPGETPTVYYVHTDPQGTPQMVTNGSASEVWALTYQPYGVTMGLGGSVTQNLRLPGQYLDDETGNNYNLARDYMPGLGRYLEADPIGLAGGMNPYLYANANPGKYSDRWGLADYFMGVPLTPSGGGWNGVPASAFPTPPAQITAQQIEQAQSGAATFFSYTSTLLTLASLASAQYPPTARYAIPLQTGAFCAAAISYALKPNPLQQSLATVGQQVYGKGPQAAKNGFSLFESFMGLLPKP
jgi:RHS repeat-associated protein